MTLAVNGLAKYSMVKNQGRRNRQRGQEGEREVCALLSEAYGIKIKRALGQARDGGTDVLELKPFRFEVKRRKKVALLYEAMHQAEGRPFVPGTIPVVAIREDNNCWLFVLCERDFIKLAREEIAK